MKYSKYDWRNSLFGVALEHYLELTKHTIQQTTYDGYVKYTKRIAEWFNEREIFVHEICPEMIEDYYQHIRSQSKVSENTVRHYHVIIYKFCKWLYNRDYIQSNPADKIDKPKAKKYNANYYNEEQAYELLDIVKNKYPDFYVAIQLALIYGLRRSEVCGLQWSCVDLKNNVIHINAKMVITKKQDGKRLLHSQELKSESSRRSLPISKDFADYLKSLKTSNTKPTDFVFTVDNGKPVEPDYLTHHFGLIIKNNNLAPIRFHDLRHSCATILINNDVSIKFVQEWLGHSCYSTTADIYSHVYEKSKIACISTMDKVLFGKQK